jgi:Phosphotransferase enzyme family
VGERPAVRLADGVAWFKRCAPVQAFEPRLTVELHARWPDRVSQVLAHDRERGWLLLADAGTPLRELGNPPELWLRILPRYAELQRGEAAHAADHLAHGVPDLRVASLTARYEDLLRDELPLAPEEAGRIRARAPRFAEWCEDLASHDIPDSVQHDDLHMGNVHLRGDESRILDWGDTSISHPFASLFVTFRFLEEKNRLRPDDPWFARLRDAYLEPWGSGLTETFTLALRVGAFAHAIAWLRQRKHLTGQDRRNFDEGYAVVLRRALDLAADEFPSQRRS